MTDAAEIDQLLATARAVADTPDATASQITQTIVETMSTFEARLQHHFARGPFYVKLHNKLVSAGYAELAQDVTHYYLLTNVLKHGGGKSLRELQKLTDQPFVLREVEGRTEIDVTDTAVLHGMVGTLERARAHLIAG